MGLTGKGKRLRVIRDPEMKEVPQVAALKVEPSAKPAEEKERPVPSKV